MKISVNCPSYKRPVVRTLEYLPFCKVWVSEAEYDRYIVANPGFEGNIISVPNEVQGNVARIRNWILDREYEAGVDAVCIIDDDLFYMSYYEKDPDSNFGFVRHYIEPENFMEFLEKYTELCVGFGFKMWGVNCNKDPLSYRHSVPFSTVSFIGGPFGVHVKSDLRYDETLPLKEDYDIFIQHCNKYRGVLRVNKFHYYCKQSQQPGGCAVYRNYDSEREQLALLRKKWGTNIVKIDKAPNNNAKKESKQIDYNPIIHIPIKGV